MHNQPNDGASMKPSHITTPRQLADAVFSNPQTSEPAGIAPDRAPAWMDWAVAIVGGLILLVVVPLIYLGAL
jgi:hypothetical protein